MKLMKTNQSIKPTKATLVALKKKKGRKPEEDGPQRHPGAPPEGRPEA